MQTLNTARTTSVSGEADANEVEIVTERHGAWSRGWVARIVREDASAPGGLAQRFVDAVAEPPRGKNGDARFRVGDGLYQADSVWRSFSSHRVLFRVAGGEVEILADTASTSMGHLKTVARRALAAAPEATAAA